MSGAALTDQQNTSISRILKMVDKDHSQSLNFNEFVDFMRLWHEEIGGECS